MLHFGRRGLFKAPRPPILWHVKTRYRHSKLSLFTNSNQLCDNTFSMAILVVSMRARNGHVLFVRSNLIMTISLGTPFSLEFGLGGLVPYEIYRLNKIQGTG